MRIKLEYQADRIEAVLAVHKVPARVTGGTVTPRWIRFQVLPPMGAKISKIKGLSEELAAALEASSCRVSRRGAAVAIEIPRSDPQQVRLLPLFHQLTRPPYRHDGRTVQASIPPVAAILGLAEDGAPLLIRLPSPDVAHVLVAGTTGSGKTVLLQTMILSLAMANAPPNQYDEFGVDKGVALILMDPKGHAFGLFEGLPHLARPVIREVEEMTEALQSLLHLMDRRTNPNPRVVVVVDELADLLMVGGKEIQWALTRLTQRGREVGIHVVAATQKPATTILGPLIKANFPVRLVGKVTSTDDARVAAGWSGTGAERLLGRGDFLAVAEGRVIHFQAAHVSPREIQEVVRNLSSTAPAASPAHASPTQLTRPDCERLPVQVLTQTGTRSGRPNVIVLPRAEPEPDPDTALAQKLCQSGLWQNRKHPSRSGTYRWGFKSNACQLLFHRDLVGNWSHKTARIIALAEQTERREAQ